MTAILRFPDGADALPSEPMVSQVPVLISTQRVEEITFTQTLESGVFRQWDYLATLKYDVGENSEFPGSINGFVRGMARQTKDAGGPYCTVKGKKVKGFDHPPILVASRGGLVSFEMLPELLISSIRRSDADTDMNPVYIVTFRETPKVPDVYILTRMMREIAALRYPKITSDQIDGSATIDGLDVTMTFSLEE